MKYAAAQFAPVGRLRLVVAIALAVLGMAMSLFAIGGVRQFRPQDSQSSNTFSTAGSAASLSMWSLVSSPNINTSGEDNWLNGVACVATDDCWVVGTHSRDNGPLETLIEHWNGSQWIDVSMGTVQNGTLNGVTCRSATDCWAVGSVSDQTLVEHWNGATWTVVASPNAALPSNVLTAVSCSTSTDCWTVGSAADYSSGALQIVTIHWDGNSWTLFPSANPNAQEQLAGVTCLSSSNCWAAGKTYTADGTQALIKHWTGASWSTSIGAAVVSAHSLNSITCNSANDCWAAGSQSGASNTTPLVEHWNGAIWTTVSAPGINSQNSILNGITCTGVSDCWAVGVRNDIYGTLIEHWDGTAWTIVSSPDASGQDPLYAVACSASRCWAVGYGGYPNRQTLIEAWSAGAWTISASPNRNEGVLPNYLNGVACTSALNCWAVGYYMKEGDQFNYPQNLVARWNGAVWSIYTLPSTTTSDTLQAVTCTSASDCWAVGSANVQTRIFHFDGNDWAIVPTPNPEGNGHLQGVACVTASNCWAVGYYYAQSVGWDRTLILHWDGLTWTLTNSPNGTIYHNHLNGVACSSGSNCWAVGYIGGVSTNQTLALHWDGNVWSQGVSANSAPNQANVLNRVSCPSDSECWAVGSYQPFRLQGLIEHFVAGHWEITPSPMDDPSQPTELSDIACLSSSDCWAVGDHLINSTQTSTLHGDGSSWTTVQSDNNPTGNGSWLSGVGCAADWNCWAVGRGLSSVEQTLTLRLVPPTVRITGVARTGDRSVAIDGDAPPGTTIQIQSSAVPQAQSFITGGVSITDSTGHFHYQDGAAAAASSWFYRVVLP